MKMSDKVVDGSAKIEKRSHLVKIYIKNIGCIGNEGLTIELDDIVCLVGANNSGKTTVLRAYEAVVSTESKKELKKEEIHTHANDECLPTVELWVHIPNGAGNISSDWKEVKDDLLLVRSKWEWTLEGGKPIRTTWHPTDKKYAEDGNASGLDAVFKSRLPKPFRIGSLDAPSEEHKNLLSLVLVLRQKSYCA